MILILGSDCTFEKKIPDGLMALSICQKMMVHCQGYLVSVPAMIHCVVLSIPFRRYDMFFYPFIVAVI